MRPKGKTSSLRRRNAKDAIIHLRITLRTLAALDEMALANRRTRSQMIQMLLEDATGTVPDEVVMGSGKG